MVAWVFVLFCIFVKMKIIEQHIESLRKLCEAYHVSVLYVFGSVSEGNFTEKSDIDFLVRFESVDPLEYFDNYLDFKTDLQKLFSREVDLIEIQTLKNPILIRSIEKNKILLYGRENSKMAV